MALVFGGDCFAALEEFACALYPVDVFCYVAGAWVGLDAFLGEVSDPCERGVDESGEECGELFGLVSFLFGFIGVRSGNMAYYTWVSMGASMPGAACFLSLRVCALAWLG